MAISPLSDAAPARVLSSVPTDALIRYWRLVGGVDVSELYRGVDCLDLCEAEDGLWFFNPMIAGDAAFYQGLYRKLRFDRFLSLERYEFQLAASHVPQGASVLDVGCGFGEFARWLDGVSYTGIDLSFDGTTHSELPSFAQIRRQALVDHLLEQVYRDDLDGKRAAIRMRSLCRGWLEDARVD